MNTVGVVICSYNGCEDTVKCLESLKRQSMQDFDVFVVDNASTDGTSARIEELSFPRTQIICMNVNTGGSGGFGAGIDHVISLGYEYIALMDNDIVLDENAMAKMMECITGDDSLGAVGAKIFWMNKPDVIFDYGDVVDLERQQLHSPFRNIYDNERLPKVVSTDFVPATAGIFRRKAIVEAGSIPVDNFIYYDDVEMGWNMLRKGWKLACCGDAKVWHKSSNANRKKDNFSDYYFQRNAWNFASKFLPEDKIETFVDSIITRTFPILFGCGFKEQWRKFETTFYLFDDFVHHVRGKAKPGRIQPFSAGTQQGNSALEALCSKRYSLVRVIIEPDACKPRMLQELLCRIWKVSPQISFQVMAYKQMEGMEHLPLEQYYLCDAPDLGETSQEKGIGNLEPDLVLHYCGHVKDQKENLLPDIYVDSHYNVVHDERSWYYYQNYEYFFELFKRMYRPQMLEMIRELRQSIP